LTFKTPESNSQITFTTQPTRFSQSSQATDTILKPRRGQHTAVIVQQDFGPYRQSVIDFSITGASFDKFKVEIADFFFDSNFV